MQKNRVPYHWSLEEFYRYEEDHGRASNVVPPASLREDEQLGNALLGRGLPKLEKTNYKIDLGLSEVAKDNLPLLDVTWEEWKKLSSWAMRDMEKRCMTKEGFLKIQAPSNVGPILVIKKEIWGYEDRYVLEYQACPNMPVDLVGEQLWSDQAIHHLPEEVSAMLPDVNDKYRQQYKGRPERFVKENNIKFTGTLRLPEYEFYGIGECTFCQFKGPISEESSNSPKHIDKNGIRETYNSGRWSTLRLYQMPSDIWYKASEFFHALIEEFRKQTRGVLSD